MTITTATTHLSDAAVTIRRATPADAYALSRLAALDSARPLPGPVLVAEVDGELWAARDLHSGRVVADPFRLTASLVALLHERAVHLAGTGRPARPSDRRAWLRLRPTP